MVACRTVPVVFIFETFGTQNMFIIANNIGLSLHAIEGLVALTAPIKNTGVVELDRDLLLIHLNLFL